MTFNSTTHDIGNVYDVLSLFGFTSFVTCNKANVKEMILYAVNLWGYNVDLETGEIDNTYGRPIVIQDVTGNTDNDIPAVEGSPQAANGGLPAPFPNGYMPIETARVVIGMLVKMYQLVDASSD